MAGIAGKFRTRWNRLPCPQCEERSLLNSFLTQGRSPIPRLNSIVRSLPTDSQNFLKGRSPIASVNHLPGIKFQLGCWPVVLSWSVDWVGPPATPSSCSKRSLWSCGSFLSLVFSKSVSFCLLFVIALTSCLCLSELRRSLFAVFF